MLSLPGWEWAVQDPDGEAGIALVGVHSEYPKYSAEENYVEDKGPASVGWVWTKQIYCILQRRNYKFVYSFLYGFSDPKG